MASQPLVLTDPNMLAEFVRQSQLKTFFEKRFAAPADLGAILFRDGAVIDGFKGTQFSIGGFWENVKGVIGGSHHYEILLASLKPFNATIAISGLSKDNVEIVGEATFELQLNPDKPTNILGLMHGVSRNESDLDDSGRASAGRKALTIPDVVNRLEPHFRERVFGALLKRHNADELRGNNALQDKVQADLMTEAERILGNLGVMVNSATINWAMNERERLEFERARVEREEEMKDYQLDLLKRQVSREADSTAFVLDAQTDTARLQRASQDELRTMVLDSEVAFVDAREAHARRQEFEALDHEARILLAENEAKTKIALTEIEDATLRTRAEHNLRKSEFDLKAFEAEFTREQAKLDRDFARGQAVEDATNESEVIDAKLRGRKASHDQDVDEARNWQDLALSKLRDMADIEVGKESGLADIEIRKQQADAKGDIDRMLAAGSLSPEQLAQVMPGLSESAAQVAIERARAEGQGAREMLDMARDMTREARDQEHRMFSTGMQGGTGMAAGLGGKGAGNGGGQSGEMVECPNCKRMNPARAKFCMGCQTQLRT